MGDDREWQKQLISAALAAATKSAVQYITSAESREDAVHEVKSKLAEVDYNAAAKAVSEVIDRVAESAKSALGEAIDSLRENADCAVEMAAERAQEQLGAPAKRGRGRMMLGILLGIALGFVLLNEERRNQIMDKISGASGPTDNGWQAVTPSEKPAASVVIEPTPVEASAVVITETEPEQPSVASESEGSASRELDSEAGEAQNGSAAAKTSSRKAKATEPKSDA